MLEEEENTERRGMGRIKQREWKGLSLEREKEGEAAKEKGCS